MPGLAGCIDFDRPKAVAETRAIIGQMSADFARVSPCVEEILCFEEGAFAAIRLERSPFQGLLIEDERDALAVWGCLWDEEELKRLSGQNFSSLAETAVGPLLLEIYRNHGIEVFFKLNGRFVVALWQKREKRLTLVSDRYGFAKLYYWQVADRILFASEYRCLIRQDGFSKKIDLQGLADFVTLGYCTEDKTFFQDIKLLPQGSTVTFEKGKPPSVKRYWDYSFYSEDDPLWTEEDYVDQFFDKLQRATIRQTRYAKKISIPISGGYDSRALAAMVEKTGCQSEVDAFSYGSPNSLDVVYGRKIARNLGFSHRHLALDGAYIKDLAENFVWLNEGSVNSLNSHMLSTYPLIQNNRYDSVLTGFFGDIICGSAAWIYSVGVPGGTDDDDIFRRQFAVHADIMNDEDLQYYFNGDVYKEVRGNTFETLRARYFACPSKSRYYRSRYFATHERQRRYTSFNLHVFDSVAQVIAPFLDTEFVDFAYHIPPPLAINQNCYRKMIVKHLPKVASVPHNETRLPLNASRLHEGLKWRWERLNRNPLVRSVLGKKYFGMNDDYLNANEAIRTGSREFVTRQIRDNPFLAQFFCMDRIHQMLDEHLAGKRNEYGKITAFLTLALWHRLFVEEEGFDRRVG